MTNINLSSIYKIVDSVITKTIEDELVIVTMNDGISDVDSSIFTLNPTGKVVWEKLDGKYSLKDIINQLAEEYKAPEDAVKKDVEKLVEKLVEKKLVLKN
ncbi:MAG: PqqD family protein [Desulfobacula sp.]|nr:PqqD family protein [Desulfobacula sp.]